MWPERSERPAGQHVTVHKRPGTGPTAVLLHGIPGSSHAWHAVAKSLDSSFELLVPDLVGFGDSERSGGIDRLHAVGQAAALQDALTSMLPGNAILVGHDFGGPVAVELLKRMPQEFAPLVLISANVFPDAPVPFPLSLVRAPLIGRLVSSALFSRPSLRMMYRRGSRQRLDSAAALGDRSQSKAIALIFGTSLRRLDELYGPIAAALSQIPIPTVVIWGDRDPFFSVEQGVRTAGAIPNATLKVLDECGHFAPEERPQMVADVIQSLAGELGSATGPDAILPNGEG